MIPLWSSHSSSNTWRISALLVNRGIRGDTVKVIQHAQCSAIGNQQVVQRLPESSAISTFISTSHIIGSGPNNNLLVRGILHVTSDENGEIIALVDRFDITCT